MFSRSRGCVRAILASVLTACLASACVQNNIAPSYTRAQHDPILDESGGVLVVADVCIRRNEISGGYFTIADSKVAAEELKESLSRFLTGNGIRVKDVVVPFVCGALHDPEPAQVKVATRVGGAKDERVQPFGIAQPFHAKSALVRSLSLIGTNAYHKYWVDDADAQAALPIAETAFADACENVAGEFDARAVLYVGVNGLSTSAGVRTAGVVGNLVIGTLTATQIASAPIGASNTLNVFAFVMPFPSVPNSRVMSASLIDLRDKRITWTNGIQSKGDPLKPNVVADINEVSDLLTPLVNTKADEWRPPGAP